MTLAFPLLDRVSSFFHHQWSEHRQRRWPRHWLAILDNGRRSQDLWTPGDWAMWDQALRSIHDLDQPLPSQAPTFGLGRGAHLRQHRYQEMGLAGYTPLALALRLRDPAPFQALIDAGANPRCAGTPDGHSPLDLLKTLDEAYRTRRWTVVAGGAGPQPWHAMLLHRLVEPSVPSTSSARAFRR